MTSLSVEMLAADAVEPITSAGNAQLGIAVLAGIAVIVLLITKFKMHAFLALTIGSLALGSFAGAAPAKTIASFTAGLGSTVAGVGVLIALGAILGKLLADSGGADQIVDTILAKASRRSMPWAMVLIASIIGLPLFFEVGIVLLIPVVLLVAKRGNFSLMRIGIPALAGLSVMHGLIPPHPGPLVAIDALGANLGVTLALGVLVAIPTVIIAGPVFPLRRALGGHQGSGEDDSAAPLGGSRPPSQLRRHPGDDSAAGRADADQGAGRHRRGRSRAEPPEGHRCDRLAADRAPRGRDSRHVHAGPGRRFLQGPALHHRRSPLPRSPVCC